ncbi:hypothetical protein [Stieleria mannarensis]|uniref:hypothetical protein n=1 Tax=Stieleria mannarensis TaxID=2755585 RepID=UPI0016030482|nr:hypothetical protein [Rhodopirellula sp. JC639]
MPDFMIPASEGNSEVVLGAKTLSVLAPWIPRYLSSVVHVAGFGYPTNTEVHLDASSAGIVAPKETMQIGLVGNERGGVFVGGHQSIGSTD